MKIKIAHILTRPEDERERTSIASLTPLKEFGIEYVQRVNEPFYGIPPNGGQPGAYGCYLAHKEAIENEFSDDLDFLIVAECDCILRTSPKLFYQKLKYFCNIMDKRQGLVCLAIGGNCHPSQVIQSIDGILICPVFAATHFLVYPQRHKRALFDNLGSQNWDCFDMWLGKHFGKNQLAITEVRWTTQAYGFSLIENRVRKQVDRHLATMRKSHEDTWNEHEPI